jgi:RNA 2',3'-cyclic 3'-phosphodiesterase
MDSLRQKAPGVRFLAPETVHLTLRFLGDATDEQVGCLSSTLAAAAAACPAAEVRIAGVGTFPERGAPRVLWLGIELPAPVLALQRDCERAAVSCGFPPEPRPFRSHVTLGRWRDRARRPELPPVDLGTVVLDALVLYQSRLTPNGAIHTRGQVWPLARKDK